MILVFSIKSNGVEVKLIKPSAVITDKISMDKNLFLLNITKWLKKANVKLDQLECLAVVFNPASFTTLRTITSVANSLAWSLNIPVYKIKSKVDDRELAIALKNLTQGKKTKSFIVPEYYKEPNITKPKQ